MSALTVTLPNPSTGGETVVAVSGEIDLSTADDLQRALDEVIEARPNAVAVDLSAVEFLDSSGLRVLLSVHEQATKLAIPLVLVSPATAVLRVLELTGLTQRLTMRPPPEGD